MSSDVPLSKQLSSSTRTCCSCLPPACSCNCSSVSCSTVLTILFRLFLLILLGTTIFLVIYFWSQLSPFLLGVLNGLKDMPSIYSALILIGANVLAALLFLPCLPFTLATGFIFQTVRGSILVCIASTIASMIAFLIGRYLARGLVERNLGGKNSSLRVIDNAIQTDGFRVVFLIRLSPIHPYAILNYLFGLTSVSLRDYSFASFFAMIPTTIMEVYSGAALSSIEDITKGEQSALSSVLLGVGLLVTIAVSIIITVWVRRKLKVEMDRYAPVSEDEAEEEEEDGAALKLEKVDGSDESEAEREVSAAGVNTTQHDVSLSVDGGRDYSIDSAVEAESVSKYEDERKEEGRMPTASDLESDMQSEPLSVSPPPSVAPIASPTQRRSRQSSPNSSPTRGNHLLASSSAVAPVYIPHRSASFSSSAPSLPPAPLSSPRTLSSNPLLTRTRSNSSNSGSSSSISSSGSSGGGEDVQLIKHS